MKKLLALLAISSVLFSSCVIEWGSPDDSDKVKELEDKIAELEKELDPEDGEDTEDAEDTEDVEDTEDTEDTEEPEEDVPDVYDGPNYIDLSSPKNDTTFLETPIIFKGTVSPNTTKVVVTATGYAIGEPTGDGPGRYEDIYRLQDFKYGDKTFTYRASPEWNNLGLGSNNYEFKAYFDDDTTKTEKVTIYYSAGGAEVGKPVIYLYPEEPTEVSVNVDPKGGIYVSEPEINDGWNVLAMPNGALMNLSDFKVYPYLFWEGFSAIFETPEEGFVIAKEEVPTFFEDKLSYLGLNEKEIADFEEFWLPLLAEDPYYFITFVPQDEFEEYAPLTVSPAPDTVIRVFFDYQGLETPIAVTEQTLVEGVREGFTVIEWGGRLY